MNNNTILKTIGIIAISIPIVTLAYLATISALTFSITLACIISLTFGMIATAYSLTANKPEVALVKLNLPSQLTVRLIQINLQNLGDR